ncbi:MAG: ribosome maturation factor RimP [Clostridia bacterium]|nr:ribosome maturation factor RimP [Clostridia bacterium]
MKITETVRSLTEGKVNELGYRLYDVEFAKEPEGYVLTLYIEAESPITLDDCEKVSRAVEPILDEKDPIVQAYYLSVSSVGLDRPLKTDEDYRRNTGGKIDIKLYAPINKKKSFTGILESYDEESFTVKLDGTGESMTFAKKSAASVKPHIDF